MSETKAFYGLPWNKPLSQTARPEGSRTSYPRAEQENETSPKLSLLTRIGYQITLLFTDRPDLEQRLNQHYEAEHYEAVRANNGSLKGRVAKTNETRIPHEKTASITNCAVKSLCHLRGFWDSATSWIKHTYHRIFG